MNSTKRTLNQIYQDVEENLDSIYEDFDTHKTGLPDNRSYTSPEECIELCQDMMNIEPEELYTDSEDIESAYSLIETFSDLADELQNYLSPPVIKKADKVINDIYSSAPSQKQLPKRYNCSKLIDYINLCYNISESNLNTHEDNAKYSKYNRSIELIEELFIELNDNYLDQPI